MIITITDQVGTSGTVTVDKDDAAEAIRSWYPEPPAEVTEALDSLQTALNRNEGTGDLETALGITIER